MRRTVGFRNRSKVKAIEAIPPKPETRRYEKRPVRFEDAHGTQRSQRRPERHK